MRQVHSVRVSLLFAIIGIAIITASSALAQSVAIGCFCMDGVKMTKHPDKDHERVDGTYTPATFEVRSRNARLYIFDRPLQPTKVLEKCDRIAERAIASGAKLTLAGTLTHLDLNAFLFKGDESRFQIDEMQLDATIGRVTSGACLIGGGSMDLKGAKLYVKNPTLFNALANSLEGTLEIEAWNRQIADAKLILPGGAQVTTTLRPVKPNEENVTIRLDTSNGAAQLWGGRLHSASIPPIDAEAASIAALSMEGPHLEVGSLRVNANAGAVSAFLENVNGRATRATLSRPTVMSTIEAPRFRWKSASAGVTQSTDKFTLGNLALSGAALESDDIRVAVGDGTPILRGPATARFALLTSTDADGSVTWNEPEMAALSFLLLPKAVTNTTVNIKGPLDAPNLDGTVNTKSLALGPMVIDHPFALAFNTPSVTAELRVPIRFKVGPVSAPFTIRDDDQSARVTATLNTADLDAELVLPLANLEDSRLEVGADRFHFSLSNTAVAKPLVAGTAPTFAETGVALSNATDLRIGNTSTGTMKIDTSLFILGQPIIRIGEGAKESRSSLKLKADAGASLRWDLSNGRIAIAKAALHADGIDFALLDDDASLDLTGTIVTAPRVTLSSLTIDIDQTATPPYGKAEAKELMISAARVTRPRTAENRNDIVFEAVPERPLTIQRIIANTASIDDSVDLDELGVYGIDFALKDAAAEFGKGFRVDRASLAIGATSIVSTWLDEKKIEVYDNASFSAKGTFNPGESMHVNNDPGFRIDLVVHGRSDKLNGSGKAGLGAFTGSKQDDVPIDGKKCTLTLPVEYNIVFGGADFDVSVADGRFSGIANIAPLALALHSKSGAECRGGTESWVLVPAQSGWTTWPCSKCCPLEFWECRQEWRTDPVQFDYYWKLNIVGAVGTILLTNPILQLDDEKFRVCNRGFIRIIDPPGLKVGGGYSWQSADSRAGPLLNPLLETAFVIPQTLLANTLLSGAGVLTNTLGTAAGNLMCMQ